MQSDTGAVYLSNKPTSKGWVYLKYMLILRLHENFWLTRQNET